MDWLCRASSMFTAYESCLLATGKSNKILNKWENFAETYTEFYFRLFYGATTHVHFFYDSCVIIMPYNSVLSIHYVAWDLAWQCLWKFTSIKPLVHIKEWVLIDKITNEVLSMMRWWWSAIIGNAWLNVIW